MSSGSFSGPIRSRGLEPGDEIDGRYRIVRELGAGGMGAVYEAEQITLHKRVAIKTMLADRSAGVANVKRFLREARAASAIDHRNVVDIVDFGEFEDGTAYYVMELLQGQDLASLLHARGSLRWSRARGILLQALRGLRAAHEQGIIHRDIKPANIFVLDPDDESDGDHVKVLDFGIARVESTDPETQELTGTSELLGTAAYMAPELVRGGEATPQSDIYALGIVAYKLLTGEAPFKGANTLQILFSHIHHEPPPPRSIKPSIPDGVEALIQRAMAKRPEDRFSSAREFGQAIEALDEHGEGASPARASSASRTKIIAGVSVALALALALWVAFGSQGRPESTPEPEVGAGVEVEAGAKAAAADRSAQDGADGNEALGDAAPGIGAGAREAFASDEAGASDEADEDGSSDQGEILPVADEPPPVSGSTGLAPDQSSDEPSAGGTSVGEAEPGTEPGNEPEPRSSRRDKRGPGTDRDVRQDLGRTARRRCKALGAGQSVTVRFTVDPNGSVLMAAADAPHGSSELGRCVTKIVDGGRFREGQVRTQVLKVKL
ncbi:MAG: protein kinase [Myxococcota bacterium]